MKKRKLIFKEEAVQRIQELLINLAAEEDVDEEKTLADLVNEKPATLNFHLNKLVENILAYCHRRDFPEPLIYTCAELLLTLLRGQITPPNLTETEFGTKPLSEVKLGDSDFKFDVSADSQIDLALKKLKYTQIASEEFFNSLKPDLNLFRKVVGF